jgi:GMP synthase (glutamine-hydrolysing)
VFLLSSGYSKDIQNFVEVRPKKENNHHIKKEEYRVERVLLLYHAWDNHKAFIGTLLDEQHIPYDIIDVEEEPIPDPTTYAAVIAFGGPQNVYNIDKHPYFVQEKEKIRLLVERDIPFLGICLGGQLLADALGGRVRPHSLTSIGFFDVQFTPEGHNDPLYAGLPGYQKVFHWHEDTFDLPPDAVLLATTEITKNQAFRYGQRAYGLQYHIELDDAALDSWLYHPSSKETLINTLGIEGYTNIETMRPLVFELYHEHTRMLVHNFLKISALI